VKVVRYICAAMLLGLAGILRLPRRSFRRQLRHERCIRSQRSDRLFQCSGFRLKHKALLLFGVRRG
jgi:hypothetical protein